MNMNWLKQELWVLDDLSCKVSKGSSFEIMPDFLLQGNDFACSNAS